MAIVQDGSRWFSVNFSPSAGDGPAVLWEWARVLEAAGWTGVQSGNGTSKSAGFPINSPFVAATTGWIQMRAPTGTFEITLQRASGDDWSARGYVAEAGFGTGGDASAPPSPPADAIQIIGTGNSYDSSGFCWASGNAAAYRWMFCADSAPHRGFYYFHAVGRVISGGARHRRVVFDTLESNADGVVGDEDEAPFAMLLGSTGEAPSDGTSNWTGWYKRNLTGEALETALTLRWPFVSGLGANPYTGTHERGAPTLHKTSSNVQFKGRLRTCRVSTTSSPATYDTIDLATTGDALVHLDSGFYVPWPSGVSPS